MKPLEIYSITSDVIINSKLPKYKSDHEDFTQYNINYNPIILNGLKSLKKIDLLQNDVNWLLEYFESSAGDIVTYKVKTDSEVIKK